MLIEAANNSVAVSDIVLVFVMIAALFVIAFWFYL
jgi:hypothetical protein